jgi:response regulator RpfG family c-di-GMP phosphodiesterase
MLFPETMMGIVTSAAGPAHFSWRDFGFPLTPDNLHIRREQLRTRMEMYPALILSQVVLQPLFVWLFWDVSPHASLLLWLAFSFALHAVEALRWLRHRHDLDTLAGCRDWHLHFTFFALSSGMLWGVAAWLFFPSDVLYQALMICIMLGLLAGAVTMNPVHPPASFAYLSGLMLPLLLRVMAEGDALHWILAAMLILFSVLVMVAGRILARNFMQSLQLRFENVELLKQLEAQKDATEQARARLEKANAELREHEDRLEQMVRERTSLLRQRTEENGLIKEATILALSSLAETRDNETGNHIRRTQRYVYILARQLQQHPRFSAFLTDENVDLLYKLAPLHDVGKVGIPDHILRKPGKLTEEEFEIMKQHAVLGGNAIAAAESEVNIQSHFLRIARQIAVGHHEKWDGSGYPFGLRGDDIPIPARLMALADVYDALSCKRVYKQAIGHDEVVEVIVRGSGQHFDPDIVAAFVGIKDEFARIAEQLCDEVAPASSLATG